MEKNKKIILYVGIGILALVLVIATMFIGDKSGTSSNLSNDPNVIIANAERESKSVLADEMKEFTTINVDKYLEYYKSPEKSIVLVARPTCGYCQIAEPIIKKIAKDYDLTINYLNTDAFSGDDTSNFVNHNEFFKEGFGTPLLLIVSNNQIVSSIDGLTDTAHYIDFLKTNRLI